MKKEFAALALLAALLAASFYNVRYIENMVSEISALAHESYGCLAEGDTVASMQKLEQAIERWEQAEGYTHIFIRHSEIDGTSDAMFDALGCISGDSGQEADGAFRRLFYHLDSLVGMERVTLGSIF